MVGRKHRCMVLATLSPSILKSLMVNFYGNCERGRFLECVFGKAVKLFSNSEGALKQAVAFYSVQNKMCGCLGIIPV